MDRPSSAAASLFTIYYKSNGLFLSNYYELYTTSIKVMIKVEFVTAATHMVSTLYD